MAELDRKHHRERVRKAYLKNSFESMSDSSVLEMLLFYSIPRKDVKEISYALLNRFKSLQGVFDADIKELTQVEGVGENTAILINLFKNIETRLEKNKNVGIKKLNTVQKVMDFAKNELSSLSKEKVIVICLDNSCNFISVNTVSEGAVNCAYIDPYSVMECIFRDRAANVVLAHNHPKGIAAPSASDINFTIETVQLCRKVNINVNDHIIVAGDEAYSMASDIEHADIFDH
ncbi:MAG: RadC family protein [Eubacterium sp.]|nr:RadC family protein [Eubacterium sp.]